MEHYPSTFKNIDFVKIDILNEKNYDTNFYKSTNFTEKIGNIKYPFRISKYPITNKIFNNFLRNNDKQVLCKDDNLPVVGITFIEMCRFCNWLTTGCTEKGTYIFKDNIPRKVNRDGYYIPDENEWHKAAFYDPYNETYNLYATYSNEPPNPCTVFSVDKNKANYFFKERTEDSLLKKDFEKNCRGTIIPVCSFINSFSPFGTYDQNGNVWEIVDTENLNTKFIKGGSAFSSIYSLKSTFKSVCDIFTVSREIGFRVCRYF